MMIPVLPYRSPYIGEHFSPEGIYNVRFCWSPTITNGKRGRVWGVVCIINDKKAILADEKGEWLSKTEWDKKMGWVGNVLTISILDKTWTFRDDEVA